MVGRIKLAQMVSTFSFSSLMTPTERALPLLISLWAVLVVICLEVKQLSRWLFMVLGQDALERTLQTAAIYTSEVSQPWLPLGQDSCSVLTGSSLLALPQSERTMTEMCSQSLLLVSISGLFSTLTQCKAEDSLEICMASGLWSSPADFALWNWGNQEEDGGILVNRIRIFLL